MKCFRFGHFFIMLCLVFSTLSLANEQQDKILFGTNLPLDSHQSATIIPKLAHAFAQMGIEFEAIYVPSNRALSLANDGVVDGDISRVWNLHDITNNQYSNLIKIDHKMLSVWVSIFSKDENIVINNLTDLNNYSVCYINGRKGFDDTFEPLIKPSHLVKVTTDLQAFQLLTKDRVDLVITTHMEGNQLIKDIPEFQHIKETNKILELPIYSYIHKKHAHLIAELAANLAEAEQANN